MLDAFEELFASGEYRQIMDKWGLSEVAVPEPLFNAGSQG
jgi:polar amino acid transport system substrate-binding protein